jgi:(p)ppGpp synthase/HD superfamily hydrolase
VPATADLTFPRDRAARLLLDAYRHVTAPPGKGLAHARTVEGILGRLGYDEPTQLAGLLHDVVEDTPIQLEDVRAAAGDEVAAMVAALTEDTRILDWELRKRALRLRVAAVGSPVVEIALADKIATLRNALATGTTVPRRLLAHYHETLELALPARVADELCGELGVLLAVLA